MDPQLRAALARLGNEYGPMGVAVAAAGMTSTIGLIHRLTGVPQVDGPRDGVATGPATATGAQGQAAAEQLRDPIIEFRDSGSCALELVDAVHAFVDLEQPTRHRAAIAHLRDLLAAHTAPHDSGTGSGTGSEAPGDGASDDEAPAVAGAAAEHEPGPHTELHSRTLVQHARDELDRIGETRSSPEFAQSIVAAVAAFSSYGHSGGSGAAGVDYLARLLGRETLTPVTSFPGEWSDLTDISNLPPGHTLWQNVRNPRLFSDDRGATFYDVDQEPHPMFGRPTYVSRPPVDRERGW